MRILYFHQHFSTPRGATGVRSYQMARALISEGHQVTMVCGSYGLGKTGLNSAFRRGRRIGKVDGIDVIEFKLDYSNADGFLKRTVLFLIFACRSIGVALTARYDLLFATSTPLTASIPGIAGRWIRRKPFVFEVRDLWPELPKEMGVITNPVILWLMGMLEWVSYHSAHRLIGLSPGIVEGIQRRGIGPDRVAMIPNGCDGSIFSIVENSWRPEGVDADDLMAVYSGTHGVANGLSSVLDAARILKDSGRSDIKVVLIGDGKLKPSLMQRARAEKLTNVLFLDPVDKVRLAGLLASSDLGLQILANIPAFYFGTSPNKFFDYLASGTPVLINYPGWLAELTQQSGCGYAVSADVPEAFSNALQHAADHRNFLPEMRKAASRLAEEQFDRKALAKHFVVWLERATDA